MLEIKMTTPLTRPTYIFPQESNYQSEIPIWTTFSCAKWNTFSNRRTNESIRGNNRLFSITVPYPKVFTVNNNQNYVVGGALANELQNLDLVTEQLQTMNVRLRSALNGGMGISPDHMETYLDPGSRREYTISFDLVAKTTAQAVTISNIANTFQKNAFSRWDGRNPLVWYHPPLWSIAVTNQDQSINPAWDVNSLPCVLKNVDINRAPILNVPFSIQTNYPLSMNITLLFYEIEPAVLNEKNNTLVNRASIFSTGT